MSDAKTSAEDAADLADEEEAIEAANERNFPAVGGAHDEGSLELLPPRQPMNLSVLETLRDHVSAMRDAKFFADGVCYTSMVPQRFQGKPGDGAAAILFGAEVGLSPIASLRSVIVIHGQPGFEARTMKAICKTHGYRFRTIEKTPTRAEIWAWEPDSPYQFDADGKRINPDEEAVWTIDDARQAGYVPTPDSKAKGGWELNSNGKLRGNMKYIETPKIMLDAKVTAEVCRAIAPHILLGLPYAAEELEDFDFDDGDTVPVARPPRRARGVGRLRERAAEAKHEEPVDAEEEPDWQFVVGKGWTAAEGGKGWAAPVTDPAEVQQIVDAINEGQPVPPPAPTQQAAAEPAPEPAEPAAAKAEPAPSPEQPAPASTPGDIPMSAGVRAKGEALMARLLDVAKVEGDDRLAVVAEIAAKNSDASYHAVKAWEHLTNAELKYVVDTLTTWDSKGKLYEYCGEALNNASLREAGMLEARDG